MLSQELDERPTGDIDFVVNEQNFKRLAEIKNIKRDAYDSDKEDRYQSYHGEHSMLVRGSWKRINVNILVFKDDITLNKQTITHDDTILTLQDTDTILYYKKEYNREKDIKDLENIATKCLEDIIAQEPEEV